MYNVDDELGFIENVEAELKNQFPNQKKGWHGLMASRILKEYKKEGDTIANIINRLCR